MAPALESENALVAAHVHEKNKHYAMAPTPPGQQSKGIRPKQYGREGADFFIQEPAYFQAYARYFRRYIEEYGKEGIRIRAVMPQNEFNSAQPFPSCCLSSQYFNAGARTWHYWNFALEKPGVSSWGWPQKASGALHPEPMPIKLIVEARQLSATLPPDSFSTITVSPSMILPA